jgi:allophanate hydrolase
LPTSLHSPSDLPDIAARLAAYRSGRSAASDLDATLEAVEAEGRPVWISVMPRAEAHALLADAQARLDAGQDLPLFGIPFGVKDNIDVKGLETTAACSQFAYHPEESAFVVRQLIAAGAIPVGKTNLDQFATGLNGTRSPYGMPACAFDEDYVSGGSSSGSAIAVAKGQVPFALGTDTAGSGRIPAGFNNIVGIKPSRGLLSTQGVVPACRSLDCVSILSNTMADGLAVLRAAAAFDPEDAYSRKGDWTAMGAPPHNFTFGILNDHTLDRCAPAVVHSYKNAVKALEHLGGTAVVFDYAPFEETAELLYAGPWIAERLAAIRDFATKQPEAIHPVVRDIILSAHQFAAVDVFEGQYRLADLARSTAKILNQFDMMLVPTAPDHPTIQEMLADPIGANSRLGLFTNFVNLLDMAAVAVPAGRSEQGLPLGVTLIAPRLSESMLAAIGDRLHRADASATLGAGNTPLSAAMRVSEVEAPNAVRLAVVGAHLRGQPLNHPLIDRGARFIAQTRTAPGYSLYALPNSTPPKPGLARNGGPGMIEIELWDVPVHAFGSFVAAIPGPLGIGSIEVEDGTIVKGFICEQYALGQAPDITHFGGWRNYLAASKPAATPITA